MDKEEILREFEDCGALLRGHFILSSGLHSPSYVQCARVMMDARRGERLCRELASEVKAWLASSQQNVDIIVAPAMGGVVVGYEMGRQLQVPSIFCERVDGKFLLRRGFYLEPRLKVLIVEDVVTTGKSSMETVECIKQSGAMPLAVASLIDRRMQNDVSLTLPLISLIHASIPTYKSDALPDELKAIPATKPGSRFLQAKAP